MSKYMSHDTDAIGYTIDGRKYEGWPTLAADMRSEFESVVKLEIPITKLQFWRKAILPGLRWNWTISVTSSPAINRWCCHSVKPAYWNDEMAAGFSSPGMNQPAIMTLRTEGACG